MTKLRSFSSKLMSMVSTLKSPRTPRDVSPRVDEDISAQASSTTPRTPTVHDPTDPVLVLPKLWEKKETLAFSSKHWVSMCRQLPESAVLSILSFGELIDLQRFHLNPSSDDATTCILIRHLFGYFARDSDRKVHLIFPSLKIRLSSASKTGINLLLNARCLELSNYHTLGRVEMNCLERIYLTSDNQEKASTLKNFQIWRSLWMTEQLFKIQTLKSFNCDSHYVLNQTNLRDLLSGIPDLKVIKAHVSFDESAEECAPTIPTIQTDEVSVDLPVSDIRRTRSRVFRINLPDPAANNLSLHMARCKVAELDLTVDFLNDSILSMILANDNLEHLKLTVTDNYQMNEVSVESLFLLLRSKRLKSLHLENICGIGITECEIISQVTTLRSLSLIDCNLSDDCSQFIFADNIESLDISSNKRIGPDFFKRLPKTLERLTMTDVPVCLTVFENLSASNLVRFKCSGKQVGDSEMKALLDFKLQSTLTHLEIEGPSNLTNTAIRFLKDVTNLQVLTVTVSEEFTQRGIQFLTELKSLRVLSLDRTYLTKSLQGAHLLFSCTNLESLHLNNIQIATEEWGMVQELKDGNSSLTNLSMPACLLSEQEVELVVKHFKALQSLEIGLPYNVAIGHWSTHTGFIIGQHSSVLRRLDVSGTTREVIWPKLLFHNIPSLHTVKLTPRVRVIVQDSE